MYEFSIKVDKCLRSNITSKMKENRKHSQLGDRTNYINHKLPHWWHIHFSYCPFHTGKPFQIQHTNKSIKKIMEKDTISVKAPTWDYSSLTLRKIKALNLHLITGSFKRKDWFNSVQHVTKENIRENVQFYTVLLKNGVKQLRHDKINKVTQSN